MVNSLKYAALASILILGAAPVALAQGGAGGAAPRANGADPAYLTQSITRYSTRHDGQMGFVGDRFADGSAGADRTENRGDRNDAYLTRRMERYNSRHNGQYGFIGDRAQARGPGAKMQTEAGRNPGYLTQRLKGYSLGMRTQNGGSGGSGTGGTGGSNAGAGGGAGK